MRAARMLLDKGEIDPTTSKDLLKDIGCVCVTVTVGRLYEETDPLDALRRFVRAVGRMAALSQPIASGMLSRVAYLGPGDVTDTLRRLVHDDRVDGSDAILGLDVSKAALAKAAGALEK